MLALVRRLLKREPKLKMVWEVGSMNSRLICSAHSHFFPYSFRNQVRAYVSRAEDVVFEGSIEVEERFARLFEEMEKARGIETLGELLDARTKDKIKNQFAYPSIDSIVNLGEEICSRAEKLAPWAGYLFVWTNYLHRYGWRYSIEVDALEAAREMGKRIHALETFEEQLEALKSLPRERVAKRLGEMERWGGDLKEAEERYLRGDIFAVEAWPIFTTQELLDRRDANIYERMRHFIERGSALIMIGERHGPGVLRRIARDGIALKQLD